MQVLRVHTFFEKVKTILKFFGFIFSDILLKSLVAKMFLQIYTLEIQHA